MNQWIGKVAAVTGASTGIGAEISAQLVKSGLKVVGLARRVDRLKQMKDDLSKFGEYHPVQCDVTKEDTIVKAFDWINKNLGGVDILVNNAGILKNSSLTSGQTADWKQVFDTNVLGLCIASRQAIASMEKRNIAGYIIHINSIAGHQIHPQIAPVLNVYVASKHAVTALTEVLRLELMQKNSNIRVTSLSPGAVRSDILEASQLQNSSFVTEINNCVLQPIDIANAVLYLLSTPPSVNFIYRLKRKYIAIVIIRIILHLIQIKTNINNMERWMSSVAIVTGASSGIGAEIAVQLVKNGLKVVGLARRIDRLNEIKKRLQNETGEFYPIQCDMTKEDDILFAFDWTKKNLGGVDLLVNNAGTTSAASISEGETSTWKFLLELNILGVLIATREAIKSMTERNVAGLIIQLNSIVGHMVPITCSSGVYPATKHSVTALTETVRLELAAKKSPIRITSISPGIVDTEIFEVAGFTNDKNFQDIFNKCEALKAIDIANAVLYLMSTPTNVNVTELTIRPTGEIL